MRSVGSVVVVGCVLGGAMLVPGCTSSGDDAVVASSREELGTSADPLGFYGDTALPPWVVALTFDDGPGPFTSQVLDALHAAGVHATFFVNTRAFQLSDGLSDGQHGALLRRIVADGHALGNHTSHHYNLAALSAGDVAAELDDNEREVARLLGVPRRLTLIRPPFGSPWMGGAPAGQVEAAFAKVGQAIGARALNVLWTASSGDASGWVAGEWYWPGCYGAQCYDPTTAAFAQKVQALHDTVMTQLTGQGAILLMHDSHPTTAVALPGMLRDLARRGYRFVTLEELSVMVYGATSAELIASPPPDQCGGNGLYCGGDLIVGDAGTLYRCTTHRLSVEQVCSLGCLVRPPGVPDMCQTQTITCGGSGLYCGGDTIAGDPSVLYRCTGHVARPVCRCQDSCTVMPPGVADRCACAP